MKILKNYRCGLIPVPKPSWHSGGSGVPEPSVWLPYICSLGGLPQGALYTCVIVISMVHVVKKLESSARLPNLLEFYIQQHKLLVNELSLLSVKGLHNRTIIQQLFSTRLFTC